MKKKNRLFLTFLMSLAMILALASKSFAQPPPPPDCSPYMTFTTPGEVSCPGGGICFTAYSPGSPCPGPTGEDFSHECCYEIPVGAGKSFCLDTSGAGTGCTGIVKSPADTCHQYFVHINSGCAGVGPGATIWDDYIVYWTGSTWRRTWVNDGGSTFGPLHFPDLSFDLDIYGNFQLSTGCGGCLDNDGNTVGL